jgi:hypothetical protein
MVVSSSARGILTPTLPLQAMAMASGGESIVGVDNVVSNLHPEDMAKLGIKTTLSVVRTTDLVFVAPGGLVQVFALRKGTDARTSSPCLGFSYDCGARIIAAQ